MSYELIYTSVPRGLRPGASGFCTVAMTARTPDAMVERLELLSGYRPAFPLGDSNAARNPVNWAHWRVTIGDRARSVLSRVAFAGADYSQRSNKFAHHIVLEPSEQPPAGPAWVLRQGGVMESQWPGEPSLLPAGRAIPGGDRPASICKMWQSIAGDAGWAGVLADAFRTAPAKPSYIVYAPGTDVLPLIEEALALLPTAMRWQVTFSTYFAELPMGATCVWRCVVAGSPAAKDASRAGTRPLIIDLTAPLGPAPQGPLTDAARTGRGAVSDAPAGPATGRARLGPSVQASAVPVQGEAPLLLDPSGARGKRRLGQQITGALIEKTDSHSPANAPSPSDNFSSHKPASGRRGVPGWLAILLCLVCLGVGGGAAFLVSTSMIRAQDQLRRDNIARLEDESRKLNLELVKTREERDKAIAQAGAAAEEAQRQADRTKRELDAAKAAAEKARQAAGARSEVNAAETKAREAEAAKAEKEKKEREAQAIAAKLNTTVPMPATTAASDPTRDQPPLALPPIPDRAQLTKLNVLALSPAPSGPKGTNHTQPAPWTDEKIAKLDRIYILLPNGDTKCELSGNRTLAIDHAGHTAVLKLSETPEGDWVAKFHVGEGKLSLTWKPSTAPELVGQIRRVLANSTILGSNTDKEWTALIAFGDAEKSPPDKTRATIPFATTAARFVRVPTVIARHVLLTAKDPKGTTWECRPSGANKLILSQKLAEGSSLPLEIVGNLSPDPEGEDITRIEILSNWNAVARDAVKKQHKERLFEYAREAGPGDVFRADSKEAPTVASIEADAIRQYAVIDAEKKEKKPNQDKMDRAARLLKIFEDIHAMEKQVDDFEATGPVEGEVRLPNGLLLGGFTLEAIPPNLRWKRK